MEAIKKRKDFIQAVNFFQILGTFRGDWKTEIKKLPEYLQNIIETEGGLYPRNIDIMLFKALFIEELTELEPQYKNDANANNTIDQLSQFAVRDPKFLANENFSFKKGLLILGKVGCGKTLIFRGYINLLKKFASYDAGGHWGKLDFSYLPAYMLTETFAKIGFDIFSVGVSKNQNEKISVMRERLFIDDIGAESIVSNFGNATNVVGEVFLRRYDAKVKTFATTNFDPKTLKQFYGDRVYSRITEMMNFLIMDGGDRRQ